MKNYILAFILLLLNQSLKAQHFGVEVNIYQDSAYLNISNFKIVDIKEFKRDKKYKGISRNWTHLIEFEFQSKTYQIPIDQNVHTITVIDNKQSEGFCNRLTYWTSFDSVRVSEHGNGCTHMNDVIINDQKKPSPSIVFHGIRVIPFNYKDK